MEPHMEATVDLGERRRHRRANDVAEHGIVCARVRPGHAAIVVDVSPDGALVETGHRLLPGTIVVLHLETLDRRESVRGRVLRSRVAGLRASGISYRGAIRFESPLCCMPPVFASEYQLPVVQPLAVHGRESATRSEGPLQSTANANVERF
jgi:hypothetical protein